MDLWQLRYFVRAAEKLNFTKAAESLHVTPSALSKKIADMESHFGVQLFLRGKRTLHLTAAGQILLNESRAILSRWDEAFYKIQQAASGRVGSLRVAYTGSFVKLILPSLARRFRKAHPDIDLHIERLGIHLHNEYLFNGDVDIAFTLSNDADPPPGIAWEHIKSDVLTVVVPPEHRLAERNSISLGELAEEDFIVINRSVNDIFFDRLIRICAAYDFTPNIVEQPLLVETSLLLVEAGFGITVLSPLADMGSNPGLRYIPLEGDYAIHFLAAWKKNNENPAISLFIENLREMKAF